MLKLGLKIFYLLWKGWKIFLANHGDMLQVAKRVTSCYISSWSIPNFGKKNFEKNFLLRYYLNLDLWTQPLQKEGYFWILLSRGKVAFLQLKIKDGSEM